MRIYYFYSIYAIVSVFLSSLIATILLQLITIFNNTF